MVNQLKFHHRLNLALVHTSLKSYKWQIKHSLRTLEEILSLGLILELLMQLKELLILFRLLSMTTTSGQLSSKELELVKMIHLHSLSRPKILK
jgi:hypothetical protein